MIYRIFTIEDQNAFAQISGDYNPMHIDEIAARRYMFGQPVVHGIHSLLWALDKLYDGLKNSAKIRSIKAKFLRPIVMGQHVEYKLKSHKDNRLVIELISNKSTMTRIQIEFVAKDFDETHEIKQITNIHNHPDQHTPTILEEDEIINNSGEIELTIDSTVVYKLFPSLKNNISPNQIATILGTTRIVGAKCPGLHSIYSELDISTETNNNKSNLSYDVVDYDKRFGLVTLQVNSSIFKGKIKAFRRPPPQEQVSYINLKSKLTNNAYSNQKALIIGGSRGLGEVTTKLLCAGGASVKFTYHQGAGDSKEIVRDISSNGGVVDCAQIDILNKKVDLSEILAKDWTPTHLYYFATPFIFSGQKSKFSVELFNKFSAYYVIGFSRIVSKLIPLGLTDIFYPSTVAIDELPINMGEYTAAKTASETLCNFLEKANRDIKIYKPRFPRLATDQTASFMPVVNKDPVPVLIDELQKFRNYSLSK